MSVNNPLFVGKLSCSECKSHLLKVHLMHMGTSPGFDHVDIYCAVCERFITHFNVSPYESLADVKENKTKD